MSTYADISSPWLALGFAVIPTREIGNKEPATSFWRYTGTGNPPAAKIAAGEIEDRATWTRQPIDEDLLSEWANLDADGLLCCASSTGDMPDLVVVDADSPTVFAWVEATFGHTPLTVESGRAGGGRHYYYRISKGTIVRSRNGMIGPDEAHTWVADPSDPSKGRWKSPIDVKSHRAYVVAAGSRHRTGLVYTASAPITRETIWSLPVFNDALYEKLVTSSARRSSPVSGGGHSHTVTGPGGRYTRRAGSPDALIPPPGPYAGMAPSYASTVAGVGAHVIGCPEHASVSGRSATLHVFPTGWVGVSCHVCAATYVYSSGSSIQDPEVIDLHDIIGDDADDLTPVELQALQMMTCRDYAGVAGLVVQQARPTMALLEILGDSMRESAEDAEEVERKESLDIYADKLRKKKEAAEALDPQVVAGAQRAMAFSKTIQTQIRDHLRSQGLPLPDPRHQCGIRLGLQHGVTGRASVSRQLCGRLSCPTCAAPTIAAKIAGSVFLPVQARSRGMDGDSVVSVGPALRDRCVYLYSVSEADFMAFRKKFNRERKVQAEKVVPNSLIINNSNYSKENLGQQLDVEAYVAYHTASGVQVVSTIQVPGSWSDSLEILGDPNLIQATALKLGMATYRVDADATLTDVAPVVVGSMGSSHGLSLDPAGIVRTATASAWVSSGPVAAAQVAAALEARAIPHEVTRADDRTVDTVRSQKHVDPVVLSEIYEAAGWHPAPVPAPYIPAPALDLDDLMAV